MPREVKAYACKYRCGQRVNTNKKGIALHESVCFLNRKTKACRTCSSWIYKGEGRHCASGFLDDGKFATYNCEHWEDADNIA